MIMNTPLVTTLWNTYDPGLPYPDPDWDKVNYLINHKAGTRMQVQQAIWCFIDGGYSGGDPVVVAMILDANLHGEGFKPMPGQWCAVLCEFSTTTQWIFIEVDP
jgi:hypothetical protein